MDINNVVASQKQEVSKPTINVGDVVKADVVKSNNDNTYSVKVGNNTLDVHSQDTLAGRVKLVITSIKPEISVKLLPEQPFSKGDILSVKSLGINNGVHTLSIGDKTMQAIVTPQSEHVKFFAEVIKTDGLLELKPVGVPTRTLILGLLAKEMMGYTTLDTSKIMQNSSSIKLSEFVASEFRRIVRDSGLFFENKLLKGDSVIGDAKYNAYMQNDTTTHESITKTQIANVLLSGELFTFFEGDDELDFTNGMMRFRRNDNGYIMLYMHLDFTNIGKTFLSLVDNGSGGYNVLIKTERDISEDIKKLDIPNINIRWQSLSEKDLQLFDIGVQDFKEFDKFDIRV